ncbi:glycosyltransferase family 2 protein [Cellvibrio sp. pealriver]|uniref:glycosyltransferase family 2 protein n=1 Tax=Cellvibrio sp. pealriver TaxID=1622269 RepID=UPI00066FE551|nr:glycosyltransferase family 2 protein [Cellvibrio sp. pealriver]
MVHSSKPWLSILIPVYNVADYLQECLDSVITQVIPGVEIIALDDCSTDDSLERLQRIAESAKTPINILRHAHNRGLSAARNTLLDHARGEYIWFLDSDDALHPGAIEELQQVVWQHEPDLVMCDFRVWREHQRFKHKWRGEDHTATFAGKKRQLLTDPLKLFEGIYKERNLHIWSKISKRSLWGTDLRFPEGRVMEDMVVTPRLALRVKTYFYQPSVWVAYRQREGSILSSSNQKKIDDMSVACEGVLDLWLKHYPQLSRKARFYFSYFCVKTHICVARDMRSLYNNPTPDLSVYRERFFEHIGWGKRELFSEYIKRGWVLRLRRFIQEH